MHEKHIKLSRPSLGNFARHEWAILGMPCGEVKTLAQHLIEKLSYKYKMAYIDAEHKMAADVPSAHLTYSDKISFHRFELKGALFSFQYRAWFNDQDIVLVNGNHFDAKAQIIVLDTRKMESLSKKMAKLTNVQLFITTDNLAIIPDFLKKNLPNWEEIPIICLQKLDEIVHFLEEKVIPPILKGLVLAGGHSVRMGTDKGLMNYHGLPQREHIYKMMQSIDIEPFISCRKEQIENLSQSYAYIEDTFIGLGPMGALLSAFRQQPDVAWLVVACDLPLLDVAALQELIAQRDISTIATAFKRDATAFPEPLAAIWEPRSYPVLLQFLAQGYSCPRKVLINANVKTIVATHNYILNNINSLDEAALMMNKATENDE